MAWKSDLYVRNVCVCVCVCVLHTHTHTHTPNGVCVCVRVYCTHTHTHTHTPEALETERNLDGGLRGKTLFRFVDNSVPIVHVPVTVHVPV